MSKAFGVVGLVFLGTMLLYSCLASPEDWTPPERNITPVPTFTWQQRRAQAVEISYDDLLQNAEEHFRKTVFFRGTVIQVVPQRGDTHVWVDVAQDGKGEDDILFLRSHDTPVSISEGDTVAFTGWMTGTRDYKTAKIPSISVRALIFEGED